MPPVKATDVAQCCRRQNRLQALSHEAGLFSFAASPKSDHVSAKVAGPTIRANAGLFMHKSFLNDCQFGNRHGLSSKMVSLRLK